MIDGKRKDLSAYFKDWNRDFFQHNGLEKLGIILKQHSDFPDVPDTLLHTSRRLRQELVAQKILPDETDATFRAHVRGGIRWALGLEE